MELTVRRGDFLNELTLMQGVVERKNTIPILSNILLKAADGHLNFTSTDLDLKLMDNNYLGVVCERSTFRLVAQPAEDFPTVPKVEGKSEVTLPLAIWKRL